MKSNQQVTKLLLAMLFALTPSISRAQTPATSTAPTTKETLVGRSVRFEQVVLNGPKYKVKPITEETPLVLRIERVYPHGSVFRYDFEVYALDAGEYELCEYLEPATVGDQGETSAEGNTLTLRVTSSLGEGQVEPLALKSGKSPWLGGYSLVLRAAIFLWLIGLFLLWSWGRKKRAADKASLSAPPPSTAERLRPLIRDAVDGKLTDDRRAILERLLLSHWREKLDLTDTDPAEGLATLRDHPEAGELLRSLEDWLHRPDPPAQTDVERLLRPYLNSGNNSNAEEATSGTDVGSSADAAAKDEGAVR